MKTILIVRGHSGSGKSTYAKGEAEKNRGVHVENDQSMYCNGVYEWSKPNLTKAIKECISAAERAMKEGNFVAVSNVFGDNKSIRGFVELAKKYKYTVKVVRMSNWFDNTHNVPLAQVIKQFIKVRSNPIPGEIEIPSIKPMPGEVRRIVELIDTQFSGMYDPDIKSFINNESIQILEGMGLIKVKRYSDMGNLRVLKYSNSVFFNAEWTPAILECRGIVVAEDGKIISRPFNKVFNLSEYETGRVCGDLILKDDDKVVAVRKINGFLGVATYSKELDKVLYSTTGTLDSDFARLAKKHLEEHEFMFRQYPDCTFMFEICDPSDPHIVSETPGAYLIGIRDVKTGRLFKEDTLDVIALAHTIPRPLSFTTTFGDAKELVKYVRHEGFMVRDEERDVVVKIKSPYYLMKKWLARSPSTSLKGKLDKTLYPEEFYPLVDHINDKFDQFVVMNEQQRIQFIENFLKS